MWKPTLLTTLLVCLAGCSSTRASQPTKNDQVRQSSQWLQPSPQLAQEMQMMAERMPWLKGPTESQNMIEWWTAAGEAGFPELLKLARDPRAKVADLAFAALAASRDKRLVPSLREIPWDTDAPLGLQYSRARCHLRLGDWSHVDVLIGGLRDELPYNRALCARILTTATNNDFGYHYNMPPEEREVSVQRWEAWYKERAPDALLGNE